jgi:type IV secretion system protein VirB6/type IV secretion system protein TrbL
MYSSIGMRLALGAALLVLFIPGAHAAPVDLDVDDVLQRFLSIQVRAEIVEAARSLFWALATISLVWTMGMLIVRQDIGEMLMELLRFMVVTGIFYWLLINASTYDGGEDFVGDIVTSFFEMLTGGSSDSPVRGNANNFLQWGLHVYTRVLAVTDGGDIANRIVACGLAIVILAILTLMTAQFVLALVMAWMLGYAGIFLLGFGGARWTSPIAISFYKNVLAVGISLLALSIIGRVGSEVLSAFNVAGDIAQFVNLGPLLAASIIMLVLSIKIPQLLYTLVTGSPLGLFAGTASVAGSAIAAGSSAALASATGWRPGGHSPDGSSGRSASNRTDSVMDAVQRSASIAGGMSDPFHVASGSDPFGVSRSADPYRHGGGGSVFAGTQAAGGASPGGTANKSAQAGDPVADTAASSGASGPAGTSTASVRQDTTHEAGAGKVEGTTANAGASHSARPDYDAEMAAIAQGGNDSLTTHASASSSMADVSMPSPDALPHTTANGDLPHVSRTAAAANTNVSFDAPAADLGAGPATRPEGIHADAPSGDATATNIPTTTTNPTMDTDAVRVHAGGTTAMATATALPAGRHAETVSSPSLQADVAGGAEASGPTIAPSHPVGTTGASQVLQDSSSTRTATETLQADPRAAATPVAAPSQTTANGAETMQASTSQATGAETMQASTSHASIPKPQRDVSAGTSSGTPTETQAGPTIGTPSGTSRGPSDSPSTRGTASTETLQGDLKAAEPARATPVESLPGAGVPSAPPSDADKATTDGETVDNDGRPRAGMRKHRRRLHDAPAPTTGIPPEDNE